MHLRPLERENKVDIWVDTKIRPGTKWRAEILAAVDSAQVAVLLVSADFLASDFIVQAELPQLLKAAEDEGARILPLLISHSRFARTEGLKDFQTANGSLTPLNSLSRDKQEEILDRLAAEIEDLISKPDLQKPYISRRTLATPELSQDGTSKIDFAPPQSSLIASRKISNRYIFVQTCLTAKGLLDHDLINVAPYDELFGPLDAPHLISELNLFVRLPSEKSLASSSMTEFSAITAICCSNPERIASIYGKAIGQIAVEVPARYFERQELVLTAAADALESAFVVAVAVPPTFIRAGHRRPEVYYQAMCGVFLVPLIDFHKRIHVQKLHIRLPRVGECTAGLLEMVKTAVGSVFSNGSWSVDTISDEALALADLADEISWAVKRLYNLNQDKWISILSR